MLAVAMCMAVSISAQHRVGSISIIPKVGFNLANLAGDVNGNSIKFGMAGGADAMYQLSDLVGLSGGLMLSTLSRYWKSIFLCWLTSMLRRILL